MTNQLWTAIYRLFRLLDDRISSEDEYQRFFENNPVVFEVLGYDAWASFEKRSGNRLPNDPDRGYRPEPDFICGRTTKGELVAFEIKTPIRRSMLTSLSPGKRKKFKADIESYISQTTEYVEFLRGFPEAREVACRTISMPVAKVFSGVLVYGLSWDGELPDIALMASRRSPPIEVIAYDQLLDTLARSFAVGRPDAELEDTRRSGGTFTASLMLPSQQHSNPAIIAELGGRDGARLMVYLEGQRVHVLFVDDLGRQRTMDCDVSTDVPVYLKIEISSDPNVRFAVLSINNDEVEINQADGVSAFQPQWEKFTLGSDHDGKNGARFKMFDNMFIDRTLNIIERLQMQKYYEDKFTFAKSYVEFMGNHFLYFHQGAMKQEKKERAPIYRVLKTD